MPRLADQPAAERPRERLRRLGAGALSDAELVGLLLGAGVRGRSAVELGATLLARHGGIAGLQRLTVTELSRTPGLGAAKATTLLAALELAARSVGPSADVIRGSDDVARAGAAVLRGLPRERLAVLAVDSGGRLLHTAVVALGTSDRVPVEVRDVLHAVIREDGVAFALVHNHPSGDPTPSAEDVETTRRIAVGARAAGLRLLDHVVVADDRWARVPMDGLQLPAEAGADDGRGEPRDALVQGRAP